MVLGLAGSAWCDERRLRSTTWEVLFLNGWLCFLLNSDVRADAGPCFASYPYIPATLTSPAFFRRALIEMDRFPNVCCLAWRVSGRDDSEDSRSRSPRSTRYKHYLFVMSSNVISISAGPFFQCPPAGKGDHHSLQEMQVEDALVSQVFCFICFPLRQDSPAVTTDKGQ